MREKTLFYFPSLQLFCSALIYSADVFTPFTGCFITALWASSPQFRNMTLTDKKGEVLFLNFKGEVLEAGKLEVRSSLCVDRKKRDRDWNRQPALNRAQTFQNSIWKIQILDLCVVIYLEYDVRLLIKQSILWVTHSMHRTNCCRHHSQV